MTGNIGRQHPKIDNFDAYLFDLDGVITPTVELHKRAWQQTFDRVFTRFAAAPYRPQDYFDSLDGRPRFEGVETLLTARGIVLPLGDDEDERLDTVIGIGNLKNRAFTEVLARDGIGAYPGSIRLLDALAERGKPAAIVSSSRNAAQVLDAAGLRERFEAVVDGNVAARQGLAGKPAPDTFVYAAGLLKVMPEQTAVFEDAGSGVRAARDGGFALVVGVDRGAGTEELSREGAHLVVQDLGELL